jgi:segregation and condensation protein B
MSLKSKIEAVIYASEEPVTLQQLVGLLGGEAQEELDALAAEQASLPLDGNGERSVLDAGTHEHDELDAAVAEALEQGETVEAGANTEADEPAAFEAVAEVPDNAELSATEEPTAEVYAPVDGAEAEEGAATVAAAPAAGDDKKLQRERDRAVRDHIRRAVDGLMREYAESDRGIEIREVASGFRMGTKPEYHDAVRGFVKSLKPALKLTLPALETLAVVAYKQPVTAAEISEIRGVDSAGVLGGLMTRKLIATAGRKQVIGRPMLYKTTRDFLLRFGLKDVNELPSMEEFERMAGELAEQEDLPMEGGADGIIEQANARGDAEHIREDEKASQQMGVEAEDAESAASDGEDQNEAATAESAAGGNDEEGKAGPAEDEDDEPGDEGNEGAVDGYAEAGEVEGEEEPQAAG